MRIYVYEHCFEKGLLKFLVHKIPEGFKDDYVFYGKIDLDIEKPKKTVVKEARKVADRGFPEYDYATFLIPDGAKNVKCTYEVEE